MIAWLIPLLKLLFKFPRLLPAFWRIKALVKNFPHEDWKTIAGDVLFILTQLSKMAGGQYAIVVQLISWLEMALQQHPADSIPLSDLKAHCEGLCAPRGTRFTP